MKSRMTILIGALVLWTSLSGVPLVASAQSHAESALWDAVRESKNPEDYRAYLDKYPDGIYAPIAKRRIASLSAQSAASSPNLSSGPDTSNHDGDANSMTECEGVNNCATWTFLGKQGNGRWSSGEIASLSVETVQGDQVVIQRTDSSGPSAGLTATYKGVRHGDRIAGEFTSSWPDHWTSKTGDWYAILQKAAQSPPPVMHVCNINGCSIGKGGTFVLENGRYRNLTTAAGTTDIWVIVNFSGESVVLQRTMSGTNNGGGTFTGHISASGNTIEDGVLKWDAGGESRFRAAWGTAIDTLPGSNPELERQNASVMAVRPVVCFPWFLGIVCD